MKYKEVEEVQIRPGCYFCWKSQKKKEKAGIQNKVCFQFIVSQMDLADVLCLSSAVRP